MYVCMYVCLSVCIYIIQIYMHVHTCCLREHPRAVSFVLLCVLLTPFFGRLLAKLS